MPFWRSAVPPARSFIVPRRQVFLYIVTVFLPCALLIGLGARMLEQERELAQKRTADHRDQIAQTVERATLEHLERIRVEETGAMNAHKRDGASDQLATGATAFIATIDSGRPVLPSASDAPAAALARDPRVRLLFSAAIAGNDSARWVVADSGRWVVSVRRASSAGPAVFIAVRVDFLARSLSHVLGSEARLVTRDPAADDRALGPALEGASLAWTPSPGGGRSVLPLAFYASALFAALGIVLLGAYFLWRDVQREARLAHMRSQFVASVSHELKTPLTSVRIFAETLRDRSFIEPRVRLEYLDTIAREADRLTRLLDNVLEFSRVERGERRYHFSVQPLPAIVSRALAALQFPLEQQGFTVHVDCEDQCAAVRCDPDAIEQAVLNLMSNAMKYSATERRIDVAIARRGREIALSVRDYGMGIAPDHRPRIFDRFYRAPTVENSSIPGTGLGLTLVQHTVQAHGGRVGLDTTPGHGSTFTLFLPAAATSAPPMESTTAGGDAVAIIA